MEPKRVELSFNLIFELIKGAFRGKTPSRVFMNHCLNDMKLKGDILDLGAGSANPSYYSSLFFEKPYSMTRIDNFKEEKDILKIDLEKPLNTIGDNIYDYVLCFNLLEHIYNYNQLVNEIYRILKQNGAIILYVPFLRQVHFDPHDYFRYTEEGLERIIKESNLEISEFIGTGTGMFLAAYDLWTALLPVNIIFNFIRILFLIPSILLDLAVSYFRSNIFKRYSLGYFIVASKKS